MGLVHAPWLTLPVWRGLLERWIDSEVDGLFANIPISVYQIRQAVNCLAGLVPPLLHDRAEELFAGLERWNDRWAQYAVRGGGDDPEATSPVEDRLLVQTTADAARLQSPVSGWFDFGRLLGD